MSEDQANYGQPAAIIEKPRKTLHLHDGGMREYDAWGWVKVSAKFISHIKKLRGAKLAIWQCIALSIGEAGTCNLTIADLKGLTGYSHTEVINSLKELDEMGYLTVDKDGKRRIYTPEFAARGNGNDPSELVKKVESLQTDDSTGVYQYESTSSPKNSTPTFKELKRVKQQIPGIESAMFQNRPVTNADLPNSTEHKALEAFERDMQLPASWEWYPAKQTKEREWRLLREFVIKTYAADPKAFEKYNTWRNQPYVKGAKSNTQIKDYPADFEVSWSDFLRANPSDNLHPEYKPYVEENKNYVPRPQHIKPNIRRG